MNSKSREKSIKIERERLIKELEKVYIDAFSRISQLNLSEASISKLSRAFLHSRQRAIEPLEEEIEKPIITKAS